VVDSQRRSTWRTARRLSPREWLALAEATTWLALARLAIVLLPFPPLARRLGEHMHETPIEDDDRRAPTLRRIRWAIAATSRRAPWRCLCLEQAVAAKMMLRTRRIPSTLYLGVAREPETAAVQAHAWVRCGTQFVTGGDGSSTYAVVSTFGERAAA
jgi:hypothetical protein